MTAVAHWMDPLVAAAAVLSLAIWLYLVLLRGGFWRADRRLAPADGPLADWPAVLALVPARDEEAVIAAAVTSLLSQDYQGALTLVVIDDNSRDATAQAAWAAAARLDAADRLFLAAARPPPLGWSGKTWALSEGLAEARRRCLVAPYLWLSDADVAQGPRTLRRLVAKAEGERLDLVSLMVELDGEGPWARLLIPPFVFFFQKLYPFAWVADPDRRTAAAAGGCVLLRSAALAAAGGFAAIRGALIDDCALAARIKPVSRTRGRGIWLGLADDSRSLRPYPDLASIWDMVARSAYSQLRHSPALLAGTVIGMGLTYLVPPLAVLAWPWHASTLGAVAGGAAWAVMAASFVPTLRLYRQPAWRAALLPLSALLYTLMTIASAWRHWRGRGGAWKGRTAAATVEDTGLGC